MKTILLPVVLCCCVFSLQAADKYEDNEIPKYGNDSGYQTIWQSTDKAGQADNMAESKEVTTRGWELLGQGDSLTAIKRFNQGWTLWPGNYKAVWGMAIVLYQRAKECNEQKKGKDFVKNLDDGIKLIEEARRMQPGDAPLLTDTAMLYATRGAVRLSLKAPGSDKDFQSAEDYLKRAEKIEKHPHIYEIWALLEEYRGDATASKKYEQMARDLKK